MKAIRFLAVLCICSSRFDIAGWNYLYSLVVDGQEVDMKDDFDKIEMARI